MKNIYTLSRCALAIIFFYHGLVPKLWFKHEQEVLMNDAMMPFVSEQTALFFSGWLEIIVSVLFIVLFRHLWLNYLVISFILLVSIAIAMFLPQLYTYAFNPFSLNLSVIALAIINILTRPSKKLYV